MKKSILFLAMLLCSIAASATIVNCSPNTNAIDWWMTQGDTLVFADGEYTETYSIDFDQAGVVLMAAEGAKPVIKTSSYFKIHATTTFIGITFDGQNTSNYAITTRGEAAKDLILSNCEFKNFKESNICIYENTTLTTLDIDSCVFDGTSTTPVAIYGKGIVTQTTIQDSEFKNYTEYCIYANDYYGARYDNLTINNCLFHDCAYSAVFLAKAKDGLEKQSCSDFKLTNSTIYNVGAASTKGRGVVELRTNSNIASNQEVLIDHVTLYNFASSDNAWSGGFYVGNSANTIISNCIAMNPEDKKTLNANPYHAYTGAEITNSLYFNCDYNAEHGATTSESLVKADPMFVDATNGDFMLYAESPAIGMGDPRWGVKPGIQPGSGKLKAAVNAAQAGATIELGDGIYEEPSSIDFNKEGLTIKAAEGTKPVVKASSYLKHNATTTFIGITFDGQDVAEYTTYSYKTDTEKDLTFINCEFKNYTKSCVTIGDGGANVRNLLVDGCTFDGGSKTPAAIKSSGIISACDIKDSEIKGYTEYGFAANSSSAHTEELSIDNTIIHDCGASAIYVTAAADGKDKQSCSSFELTNSTIYNIGNNTKDHGAVDIRDNANITSTQQVHIDHVTLYNFNTKDWYGGFMIYQSANATISNCIVSNPADLSGKNGYHVYGNAVVTNSLYNNCNITSGAQQTANTNADPMFVDATNGNFQLYANSPAVGKGTDMSNLGDPRWGVSAKVLGKRIAVTPSDVASLPWMIQSDESNVKAGDTIVLEAGTYELSSFELRKEGLVIMAAENAEVKIATKEGEYLKLVATTTFDGITFDGSNVANYAIRSIGTSAKNLIVRNCEFTQYARYNIYGADGTHLDSLVVDNCIFSNSGAVIYFPASTLADNVPGCSYAKITNSTLYNIILNDYVATIDIQENNNAKETGNTELIIDHVTIYNFASTAKSAIKAYKSGKTTITNTIVANPNAPAPEETIYSFYIYGGATVQNSLSFNAKGQWVSQAYTDTIQADPLFVDAANGNFMLKYASPAVGAGTDGSNLGDPRWGVEEPSTVELGNGDNSAAITANAGQTVDIQINRSFTAIGEWYTICFPFSIPLDQQSKLGTIYTVGDLIAVANGEGVNISIQPISGPTTAYEAYLVKPSAAITNPVFEGVTIEEGEPIAWSSTADNYTMEFVGTINAGGQTDGSQYYIGDNGYLYNGVVDILGLRAFFTFTENGQPAKVRARVVAGTNATTGVDNVVVPEGQVLKVIENGLLIIIRGGEKFNAQGVRF